MNEKIEIVIIGTGFSGICIWSRQFALQGEITRRSVTNADAPIFNTALIVSGAGALSNPSIPSIEGSQAFAGKTFHSAQRRHDVDLQGKRLAVIGSGASAIQFVPHMAPVSGRRWPRSVSRHRGVYRQLTRQFRMSDYACRPQP